MNYYLPKAGVQTFHTRPHLRREGCPISGGYRHAWPLILPCIGHCCIPMSGLHHTVTSVSVLGTHLSLAPPDPLSILFHPAWTESTDSLSFWLPEVLSNREAPCRKLEGGKHGQTMHFWVLLCEEVSGWLCPLTKGHSAFPGTQQYMAVSGLW